MVRVASLGKLKKVGHIEGNWRTMRILRNAVECFGTLETLATLEKFMSIDDLNKVRCVLSLVRLGDF